LDTPSYLLSQLRKRRSWWLNHLTETSRTVA